MAGNRPGPRAKGDRSPLHVRVPKVHRAVYEKAALAAGMPLGDYVAIMLARAHELDEPDYVHRNQDPNQVALPLPA